MIWIGLAIVVVVALALLLREPKPKRTTAVAPKRTSPNPAPGEPWGASNVIERASDPQPIERVERLSPGRVPGGTVVDGGPPPKVEAVAHQVAPAKAPARPRKPRATSQTVLEVVQRVGPATAKEVAAQLRDTTPAKVSSMLVGLRTDRKVTSETRRNLKVWSART